MSFFERAKAAATDLAAKADVAMNQAGINTPGAGGGDRALRDLGVLAYLEATGRPASPEDRARLIATLHELESTGRLGPLTVSPPTGTPGAPPPPPGATPPPPPPPGSRVEPPPPPAPPGYAGDPPAAPPGSTPPPPPPSWA